MLETQAREIAGHLEAFGRLDVDRYEVEKLETDEGVLRKFHQWANGKPLVGGYRVTQIGEETYYLLLIDWHRDDKYYLVIYNQTVTTTVAELQRTVEHSGGVDLLWTYAPFKRDGLNAERKAHFKRLVGSLHVEIPLPRQSSEVAEFLDRLFALSRDRQLADRLPLLQKG
jgi:hypothetical protein